MNVTHKKLLLSIVSLLFCLIVAPVYADDITLRVVQETSDALDIEISILNYSFIKSPYQGYKKIVISGCSLIKKSGAPGTLLRGQLLEIPEDKTVQISYQTIEKITLSNVLLAPVPHRIIEKDDTRSEKVIEEYRIDTAIYSTDNFYPGTIAAVDFTGYLRDKPIANILVYPVQYNPVSKKLELHKKIKIHVSFTDVIFKNTKTALNSFISRVTPEIKNNNPFNSIYRSTLLNFKEDGESEANYERGPMVLKDTITPLADETDNSPFLLKMNIQEEGVYKVRYEDLNAQGVDLTALTNENIKVLNHGVEQPLYRSGSGYLKPGDYILFYGVPFKSLYAKNNVYWLYQGTDKGKKMEQKQVQPVSSYPVLQTFENTIHAEEDLKYWESIANGADVDHWFWASLQPVSETQNATAQFAVTLGSINTKSGNFSMRINLRGETTLAHHTKVYVNNEAVADFTWQGQIEYTHTISNINPLLFRTGENTVRVEELLEAVVDRVYVNWFDINYISDYSSVNDNLKFKAESPAGASFSIKNFSTNKIDIFDITDTLNPAMLLNAQVVQSGNIYTVTYSDMISGTKIYYAAAANQFKTPTDITVDETSNLRTPRANIDYIIITHELFSKTIRDLADYRQSKGLGVEVVKIQDIYDEFSYGIKDAQAIKDFLTYAYNNWNSTDHPTYVLLVGDASIDYRDDSGNFTKGNIDFVPTYLTQTITLGDTPTDNWFVCVNGTDIIPDMFIGRMCVKTDEDVTNIINKIKAYEEGSIGSWVRRIILASDGGAVFTTVSDNLAKMLPINYIAEKIYVGYYTDVTAATSDLVEKINAGSLVVNYTGHGSVDNWSGGFLFHTPDDKDQIPRNDVDLLNNGQSLTFVITLDCLNGFFPSFFDKYSLAEEFVRAENKGAIACFASTGLGFTSEHEVLARNIFDNIFKQNENIVGKLVTQSKIAAYSELQTRDIIETFVLLGDPATELKISAVSSAIKLLNPGDAAVLHRINSYTFNWDDTSNTGKYKLEFSADPGFSENKIVRVPLIMSQYITNREYTPNVFIWFILNVMSMKNETLYWRVVSYETENKIVDYSQIRSFTIKR